MKQPAKIKDIEKAIESLASEQSIILYFNGTPFGAIDEVLEEHEINKMDDKVLELCTDHFRLYFDEFEIRP